MGLSHFSLWQHPEVFAIGRDPQTSRPLFPQQFVEKDLLVPYPSTPQAAKSDYQTHLRTTPFHLASFSEIRALHSDVHREYEKGESPQKFALQALSRVHSVVLANGKIESFWNPLEGRLVKMLARVEPLTLDILNQYTQPWVTFDYNQGIHSETGQKPIDRYMSEKNVAKKSRDYATLGKAFRRVVSRMQRLSDGTVNLEGVTFQVPRAFRHMRKLHIAYSQWDLSSTSLVDPETGIEAAPLFPIDKNRNAEGRRAPLADPLTEEREDAEISVVKSDAIPPLLARYMQDFQTLSPVSGFIPHEQEPS